MCVVVGRGERRRKRKKENHTVIQGETMVNHVSFRVRRGQTTKEARLFNEVQKKKVKSRTRKN